MTSETMNRIINEQEDSISALKVQLSEMEDERDLLQDRCNELLKTLQRIANSHYPDCGVIAKRAVAEFKP
jgi:uncharacterized coiled-coil protein SlyX